MKTALDAKANPTQIAYVETGTTATLGDMPEDETNLLITEYGEYIVMGGYRIRVSR